MELLTTAQTEDLDVIPKLWTCQCKQSRCKEHGFVIRMRNEEHNSPSLQCGERLAELRRIQPEPEEEDGQRSPRDPGHSEERERDRVLPMHAQ